MSPPSIILVRPQMGENIGAAARAMSNFGLTDLRLVAPRDGWPNPAANSMASGADDIIANARVFSTFADSIADCQYLLATTARPRDMVKPVYTPNAATHSLHPYSSSAIIFGPERSGLENAEIALADGIIEIPTADKASLNLAQAVVVIAYAWRCYPESQNVTAQQHIPTDNLALSSSSSAMQDQRIIPAPRAELEGLMEQLETYLDTTHYWREVHKKPIMWRNIQTMLVRMQPTPQEVQSLRGLFRRLFEYRD